MKILTTLVALTLGTMSMAAHLDIVPDKPHYQVDETAIFTVTAWESDQQKLTGGCFEITLFDSGQRMSGNSIKVDLSVQNPLRITVKAERSGFIMLKAGSCTMPDGQVIKWANKPFLPMGAAAVAPEKLQSATALPEDFDEFWQRGIEKFKHASITVVPAENIRRNGYNVFRLTVALPDKSWSMDGLLSVPQAPGKYPAVVSVPGAGPGTVGPVPYVRTRTPAIELFMNLHNFPMALTSQQQQERYKCYNASFPEKAYMYAGADDRGKYTYFYAWLALNRAVDHILLMDEFDGKNLAATGSSQGGGSALALAYLNKRVSCVVANVPAFCDHHGWKLGRSSGWPHLHDKLQGRADAAAPYFDAANFARFIRVPALISAGYVDTVCPPSSVYAMYNNLPGRKTFYPMYRQGHVLNREFSDFAAEFLQKEFGEKP